MKRRVYRDGRVVVVGDKPEPLGALSFKEAREREGLVETPCDCEEPCGFLHFARAGDEEE